MMSQQGLRVAAASIRRFRTIRDGTTITLRNKSATVTAPAATKPIPPAPTVTASGILQKLRFNRNFAMGIGGGCLLAGLHSATGSSSDFYDYRFKSKQDPDDLASFYGGEELMELFCIFPIVGQIMMRAGTFDDTGNFITTGFPGTLKANMVFSDEANDDTGQTDWFNKRERFRDTLFGYTCWDMVINFGFRTLEDGSRECYHFGEYFHGNLPVISQIALLVFKVHARIVIWSTEHHINHYAFAPDDEEAEENEVESRANMPLFLLRKFIWSDLKAMVFGHDKSGADETDKQPSFLLTGSGGSSDIDDEDDDDDIKEEKKLPFQQKAIQIQISEDIASDKRVMKNLLARHQTQGADDVKAVLVRRHTLARARTIAARGGAESKASELVVETASKDAYVIAKDLAVDRAQRRRMTRQRTARLRPSPNLGKVDGLDLDNDDDDAKKI